MKLELPYIALNTDTSPPVLTASNGFRIVASPSNINQLEKDCKAILAAIDKLRHENPDYNQQREG